MLLAKETTTFPAQSFLFFIRHVRRGPGGRGRDGGMGRDICLDGGGCRRRGRGAKSRGSGVGPFTFRITIHIGPASVRFLEVLIQALTLVRELIQIGWCLGTGGQLPIHSPRKLVPQLSN